MNTDDRGDDPRMDRLRRQIRDIRHRHRIAVEAATKGNATAIDDRDEREDLRATKEAAK